MAVLGSATINTGSLTGAISAGPSSAYQRSIRSRLTSRPTMSSSTVATAAGFGPMSIGTEVTNRSNPSCHPSGPKSDDPASFRARSMRTSGATMVETDMS